MPGVDHGEGVLEPGGTVRLLEEVTVVDDYTAAHDRYDV